jgi:hypothetical protein
VPIQEVLLVPGLFEPPAALGPLRRHLAGHFPRVWTWRDRWVFRDLQRSVDRLGQALARDAGPPLGLVTHSFGDWVVRHALRQTPQHRVAALVSLAPVMRAGLLSRLAGLLSCNRVPELAVINDAHRAASALSIDPAIRRLVVWARFDESVRPIELPPQANTRCETVNAVHLSIIIQPAVLRRVAGFLSENNGVC